MEKEEGFVDLRPRKLMPNSRKSVFQMFFFRFRGHIDHQTPSPCLFTDGYEGCLLFSVLINLFSEWYFKFQIMVFSTITLLFFRVVVHISRIFPLIFRKIFSAVTIAADT